LKPKSQETNLLAKEFAIVFPEMDRAGDRSLLLHQNKFFTNVLGRYQNEKTRKINTANNKGMLWRRS
jgi:hypothetical protein